MTSLYRVHNNEWCAVHLIQQSSIHVLLDTQQSDSLPFPSCTPNKHPCLHFHYDKLLCKTKQTTDNNNKHNVAWDIVWVLRKLSVHGALTTGDTTTPTIHQAQHKHQTSTVHLQDQRKMFFFFFNNDGDYNRGFDWGTPIVGRLIASEDKSPVKPFIFFEEIWSQHR